MNTPTDSQFVMDQPTGTKPKPLKDTIVLQPRGCLDQKNGLAFRVTLEQALQQATQTVIIDLLWIEAIDPTGLEVLKVGMQLAANLGKVLSFQPMNAIVLTVLAQEQALLRANRFGSWTEIWHDELDHFLCRRIGGRIDPVSDPLETRCIASRSERNYVPSSSKNRFAPPADYVYPPVIHGQRTA